MLESRVVNATVFSFLDSHILLLLHHLHHLGSPGLLDQTPNTVPTDALKLVI